MKKKLLLSVFGLLISCFQAHALTVSPIYIKLSPITRTVVFSALNDQQGTAIIQVSVKRWTQVDGKDRLASDPGIIVYPLEARIQQNHEQVFRLMLRHTPTASEYYRVFVNLIDAPFDKAASVRPGQSFSLPMFVEPLLSRPALRITRKSAKIQLENIGDGFDFIESVNYGTEKKSVFQYILPGSSANIIVSPNSTGSEAPQSLTTRRLGYVKLP